MALTLGAILLTKAYLQRFDWYAYQPNAWLHPWALQIQGSVLGFICLAWIGIRILLRRHEDVTVPNRQHQTGDIDTSEKSSGCATEAWRVLYTAFAFDQPLGFVLLAVFFVAVVFGP